MLSYLVISEFVCQVINLAGFLVNSVFGSLLISEFGCLVISLACLLVVIVFGSLLIRVIVN